MPLRSGTFRGGLSPFGSGVLPPYQDLFSPVITPPGGTSTPPGTAPPPPSGAPPKGTAPKVSHVPVKGIPRPASKPSTTRPVRPKTGVQAVGRALGSNVQAVGIAKPRPVPSPLSKAKGIGGKVRL